MNTNSFQKFITLVFLLIVTVTLFSQKVSIRVIDNSRNPLPGATVSISHINDSAIIYSTTNIDGVAFFENLKNTTYLLKVSYIGFTPLEKAITIKSNERNFTFKLEENAYALDEVTIAAQKPLIRQEGDKMIIDPESLAHAASNTLEVLESTPGLYVDQDNGIFLNSATPAKVYINGREQKLSSQDISMILQSLPPGSVEKIEVLRTPSTKYDAASSGGIINVVLKKGVKIGRFGSLKAGLNQGKYGNRNIGFSLNDSGDKFTTYINGNYSFNDRQDVLNTYRFIATDTLLSQNSSTRQKSHNAYIGYGINYDISEKLTFSYDGRINYSLPNNLTKNTNYIESAELIRISQNENDIENLSNAFNLQQDFGFNYKLDTSDSDIDTKISYNFNRNIKTQDYSYLFTIPTNYQITGDGSNNQNRHFVIIQTDLTKYFNNRISFETGLKTSYQQYSSNSDYFVNYLEYRINDSLRTNHFNYLENINAAYIQASKTFFKDLILKVGARAEHTYMNGTQQIPTDTSFLINRVDLFPYVYLSRSVFKLKDIELRAYAIYRKTINRPDYNMLNPSINFVDQFMYEAGNPSLKPQFTDNIEFNVSFNDFPVFAVGQNYTNDIFSEVIYTDPNNSDIIVRTYDNLGKSKETYFRGMVGIPPGGAYFFAIGTQYNLNEYDGYYQGEPLQYTRGSWRFFTFHMLRLFGNTKLTMSGFMMTKGQMGFLELETFGSLNFGLRQSFLDDRLQIAVNARDVLKTMLVNFSINQGSIYTYGDRYTDNQRFGFKITYKFGLAKKDKKDNPFNFEEMQ
ncbi:MAG: outer membrane beta-barrel protein [Bacteroidales bacterium]|nr:outer membrane beta-barrel protein [Bacteroidales bacterium]